MSRPNRSRLFLSATAGALLFTTGFSANATETACSADAPCQVEGGFYRAYLPADLVDRTNLKTLVYFHGWQGSADGVMANEGLRAAADELDVLLIAPNGEGKTWSFPGSPSHYRDETAFVAAVMDDVESRFPIDPARTVATGFSMGASMAWFVACDLGDRFAGFIPVAGAYWDPIPTDCDAPVPNLIQVHGTSDTVVPMEGRPIREVYRQSDVEDSLSTLREKAACDADPEPASLGDLSCRKWTGCGRKLLELCTHPGGHIMKPEWIVDAYRKLMDPAQSQSPDGG